MNKVYVLSVYDCFDQNIEILGAFNSYENAKKFGFKLKRFSKSTPNFLRNGLYDMGNNIYLEIEKFEIKEEV